MFKFLKIIVLLAVGFFAGRLLASELFQVDEVFVTQEVPTITVSDLYSLIQNEALKNQYPTLYAKLLALLATPQIGTVLAARTPQDSQIYTQFAEFVKKLQALV